MELVEFNLGRKRHRTEGELLKDNPKTVIVKMRRAGETSYIKRHKEKHGVVYLTGEFKGLKASNVM